MKLIRWLFLALAFCGMTAQASAVFNYSYRMYHGNLLTGSVKGEVVGNTVINLSEISAYIDGLAFQGNGHLFSYSLLPNGQYQAGGAVISFDGKANNFKFSDANTLYGAWSNIVLMEQGYHYPFSGPPNHALVYIDGPRIIIDDPLVQFDRWGLVFDHTVLVTNASIPEPASLALIGLGLAGLALARRRKSS